ncbi:MAG: hypothetical protein M3321_05065 [Actinomycetota bacterium]|nr:hypothetical protein [Actinomycetota bacterium]
MKLAVTAIVVTIVAGAHSSAPPAPGYRLPGQLRALAAAGPRVAIATSGGPASCLIRVVALTSRRATAVAPPRSCRDEEADVWVSELWLGRSALAAETIGSSSPHGELFELWTGPLPRGPLRERGAWGWTDSDPDEPAYGCAWSVAAGGGVIAMVRVPNRLGAANGVADEPTCPAPPAARIVLLGAPRPAVTVAGSWNILATDGKRLALARLGVDGAQTGELALVDLRGKRLRTPAVSRAVVRAALWGKLTPEGLVLETRRRLYGPGWSVAGGDLVTASQGRLFYLKRRAIHVRRIRGRADRVLLSVRDPYVQFAAGSFGLAVATTTEEATTVRRIPWRTIDTVMPRR